MPDLARILIFLGALLLIAGFVVLAFHRLNVPLGRLPGDLSWRGRGWSISFPIVTSIILSLVLSLLLWIVNRFLR